MSKLAPPDKLTVETHFAFGKNWASYAALIGEREITEAEHGLQRLLPGESLAGKRFLDIGCGSGLHSLAALRLGAAEILATDIDPDSVSTARAVLDRHAPGAHCAVQTMSVFDLDSAQIGLFDVVYSWGVLHHTGDIHRALRQAAALVAPGGALVFALYRKTWMCWFWKLEKRFYSRARPGTQRFIRSVYLALYRVGLRMRGRRFKEYVRNYKNNRGMDFYHDIHDWLGGYPYESISPAGVALAMDSAGLVPVKILVRHGRLFGRHTGLFGSSCDEYAYRRASPAASRAD